MQNQTKPAIKIVGFKRLDKDIDSQANHKRFGLDNFLINVVLIEIGGSESQRDKLKNCEKWIRGYERIRLWKISKKEAFQNIYRQMMKQPLPVYFISLISIQELNTQPLQHLYKQQLKQPGSLNRIHAEAKHNIQRIKFIILNDHLQSIAKQNYFHAGIALITSRNQLIYQLIEDNLKKYGKLKSMDSSSSINSQDYRHLAKQMDQKVSEGVDISPKRIVKTNDPESEAWKLLNNTPGVGSYDLTRFPK